MPRLNLPCLIRGLGLLALAGAPLLADNPVPRYPAQAMVQWLDTPYPPPELLRVVNDARDRGIPGNQIVVAFDFDGTVVGRNPKLDQDPKEPEKGALRGGENMLKALAALKAAEVNLLIDTAAKPGRLAAVQAAIDKYKIQDYFSLGLQKSGKAYASEGDFQKAENEAMTEVTEGSDDFRISDKVYMAGNIVTGADGYNKGMYLDEYVRRRKITPRLVILLDDGAVNVLNLRTRYLENSKFQYIGFHVPQVENALHAPLIAALKDPTNKQLWPAANKIFGLEPGELEHALEIQKLARENKGGSSREESKSSS